MSELDLTVDGIDIAVTHSDKVLFGASGITKGDLARYFERIGPTMLPHVRGRPMTLVRHPNGIDGQGFFQKNTPDHYPDWIPRVGLDKKDGVVHHCVVDRTAALVYFAQQNVITPHIGLARTDDLDHPDRFVVDLDPSVDDFDQVRRVALGVREALVGVGLVPFVQLTGSKGLHVVVPLDRSAAWSDAERFGHALSSLLLQRFPDDLTMQFSKSKRGDSIYLDMGRNGYQATIAAPYGVRAYEGAPVVTPIEWGELDEPGITSRRYTIATVFDRLDAHGDAWAAMADSARPLPRPR